MSLVLFAVVAGSAALGGYLAGRAARRRAPTPDETRDAPWTTGDVLCFPGGTDVVLAREERVLRGDVELARLYESDREVVVLLPPPDARVLLLVPHTLEIATPPPSALELGGRTFERVARFELDPPRTHLAEYRDADAAALVLASPDGVRVWVGTRHRATDVDRLGGETR